MRHAHSPVDDGRTAVLGNKVRDQDEAVGELSRFSGGAMKKHFWCFLMAVMTTSGGTSRKGLVKHARQHHRPFDEAGILRQKGGIFDKFEFLAFCRFTRALEDDRLALLRIPGSRTPFAASFS